MSIYDQNRGPGDAQPSREGRELTTGYRPGWIWVPVAATLLLILLVVATGFIFGDYSGRTRAYDNGTLLEQRGGQVTMPGLATPVANPNPPEAGNVPDPGRPLVIPEEAPPLANDGL